MTPSTLFASHALLPDGWQRDVVLAWDAAGRFTSIDAGVPAPRGVPCAAGPVLPGMPNLHSHAFQRAMAGLTEYRSDPADSFWSWRTLMYRFAAALNPEDLEAIARQLYIEMLLAGYTSVCEFHYLHHDRHGQPYAERGALAQCLIRAAADTGIGLTLLPVLYQYSGFGSAPPMPEQARFIHSAQALLDLLAGLRHTHAPHDGLAYGVAPHSLRAVSPESLQALLQGVDAIDPRAPVHIHIAEQIGEVQGCIAALGARPVQWLLDHVEVDGRWCLVHATHTDERERRAMARSGAVVGLCPSTEANLGDGIFDAPDYLEAGGRWGIGSDSHASVSVAEELRLLEYSQRWRDRRRNVLASARQPHVADALYLAAQQGGAAASGRPIGGLARGQRADFLVLDGTDPAISGVSPSQALAGMVFGNHGGNPIRDVVVGGRRIVDNRTHAMQAAARHDFVSVRRALLT